MRTVRDLFRDSDMMEFIIVTIPAVILFIMLFITAFDVWKDGENFFKFELQCVFSSNVSSCQMACLLFASIIKMDHSETTVIVLMLSVYIKPLLKVRQRTM